MYAALKLRLIHDHWAGRWHIGTVYDFNVVEEAFHGPFRNTQDDGMSHSKWHSESCAAPAAADGAGKETEKGEGVWLCQLLNSWLCIPSPP